MVKKLFALFVAQYNRIENSIKRSNCLLPLACLAFFDWDRDEMGKCGKAAEWNPARPSYARKPQVMHAMQMVLVVYNNIQDFSSLVGTNMGK